MESPIFIAREPRVFAISEGAPVNGRVFVTDQGRWYERLRDDNGKGYFVHVADSEDEFQRRLEADGEPAIVEITEDDPLAAVAIEQFDEAGRLYPEVPVISDDDLAA